MAVDKKPYQTKPYAGYKFSGSDEIVIVAQIAITNGDGAGSIYRIGQVPSNYIPVEGEINCEAITGLTDADLGLYETDEHGGAVLDKDLLVDGVDLSSALVPGAGHDALKSIGVTNIGKRLCDISTIADGSAERQSYMLALTAVAAPGATGVVAVRLRLVNGA